MIHNLTKHKIIWILTAVLALFASTVGVFNIGIYTRVVTSELIPGALSQDLMTVGASLLLLVLTFYTKDKDTKKQIIILGLLGYLFYAYGIYVIERAYNMLYIAYLAIFTLSFWGMIYDIAQIKIDILRNTSLPSNLVRRFSTAGSLLQPLIFYPMWIAALIPLMQTGNQIDALYSIYIIDLCFIMPAFAILSVMTFKKQPLGLLLAPALFILGFTLIFSLAMGELVKPYFNESINLSNLLQASGLSVLFLVLGFIHLKALKVTK